MLLVRGLVIWVLMLVVVPLVLGGSPTERCEAKRSGKQGA
jgi:hypothetical protein